KWFSAYDGESFTDARRMDIDHFVPLQQAFVSGARKWNLATRTDYANDLAYIGSLIAVSAASNRSKGAQDPADWMPPRAAFRCRYVGTWIAVKYRWRLTADRAERHVLRQEVKQCGSGANVPKPRRAEIKLSGNG
ncbi:MAG: HNH endonuclease family protein, partial [Phycisphaerales bacterium]|nr:HNH endonuclease family protein [Phycisphaerales bacterium]